MPLARAWGLLPIAFFAAYTAVAVMQGRGWDALWICHVANIVLGIGILVRRPLLVRAAVLLIVPGVPLWIYDVMVAGHVEAVSVVSHLGGLAIGIPALVRLSSERRAWPVAFGVFLAAQLAARLFTPPALNVNLAHGVYPGWDRWFASHEVYWAFLATVAAALLWILDRLIPKSFFPTPRPEATS